MKRRTILRVSFLVCLVGLAVGLWLLWTTPQHRINLKSAEQVRKGLTRDQVIEVLGVVPGDYRASWNRQELHKRSSVHKDGPVVPNEDNAKREGWTFEKWVSDECGVFMFFDQNGEVSEAWVETWSETFGEKMRRWTGFR